MNDPAPRPASPLQRLAQLRSLRVLGRLSLGTYRLLMVLVLLAGFGTAVVVLSLRFYVLPTIDQHRDRIAGLISEASGQKVTIGSIAANWNGLRPHLSMREVVVHDAVGRPALELQRVEATLSWRSMLVGGARMHRLEVVGPSLTIRRDAAGRLSVAGLPVSGAGDEGGFGRWVLAQRGVVIRDAAVVWIDEARGAPELWLKKVNLRLESSGRQHRLGVTAVPPDGLAAPLDLRAEWRGSDLSRFADWEGRVFVELRDTSLSGWEAWIDLPGGVQRGTGAVRLWAERRGGRLTSLISDVELTSVRATLAPDLEALAFETMSGRLSWRHLPDGFEVTANQLALSQAGRPTTAPTVARLRWREPVTAPSGGMPPAMIGGHAERTELTASALEIAPWVALAGQLPLDTKAREWLAALSPRGRLSDVSIAWEGSIQTPTAWQLRARFDALSVEPWGTWPGIDGVSGSIDGSERAGVLRIDSRDLRLALPTLFPRPMAFDAFTGQANWSGQGPRLAIQLGAVSFTNADLAGTLSGEIRPWASKRGEVDLTGALSRVQATAVARYMPLVVGEDTRRWLGRSLLSGRSTDVRLRLKGDLEHFPFSEPGHDRGQFLVTVKAQGVDLDYSAGWPKITGIDGDLVFRANRMEILPRNATIAGVKLQRVRAFVPDILHHDEVLEIVGEAESATSDFLRFIAQSPVDGMLDGATRSMDAQGRGRLSLKLVLPLRHLVDSTVTGSFQFAGNRLVLDRDLPVLDSVNGRLEFTESALRVNGAAAQMLGGPTVINVASQRDGSVRVGVSGRATAEQLRRELPAPFGQSLRGATDWRATVNYRRKVGDLVVESSLAGMAIELPPPFGKVAAETLPLRVEQVSGTDRDRIAISLGSALSAQVLRRIDAGQATVERASVVLGGAPAPVPERLGVSVGGALRQVSVDAWRPLIAALASPGGGQGGPELAELDLRIGQVEAIGRRFNDVVVKTTAQPGGWAGSIASKEVSGELVWRSQGRGRLVARLRQINLPPARATQAVLQQAKFDDAELPALDIAVDSFLFADKALGRLELLAQPEGRDWRIDRLRILNPDATFQMEGLWQSWMAQPRTQVNVRLDIVDSGRLLARLGYPEGVRGGAGRIEGALSWAGSPQELDLATLGGTLLAEVSKGQFLTLEPGVGRLLGVVNLQSLPRRIALDFRDVFSEGFAFDEIVGTMRISRGTGRLDGFRIQGPAARVLMSGELNLAKETQNLHVRVTPTLGDSLALAGALLGGPVAGIASFLAQRAFKDPLAQLATFDYAVTGTWAEPTVSRTVRPEPGIAPGSTPGNAPSATAPAPG
ncbi:MAG: YhdP family protein [bacterium]